MKPLVHPRGSSAWLLLVCVYPGANGDFTLFSDDSMTYAYENGVGTVTRPPWDDASRKLTHQGKELWTGSVIRNS